MLCRKFALGHMLALLLASSSFADSPGQATGFKVGEVTDTSAIVWTRTTMLKIPNPPDAPMFTVEYERNGARRRRKFKSVNFPPGADVSTVRFAAPGTAGQIRIRYRPKGNSEWTTTVWHPAYDSTAPASEPAGDPFDVEFINQREPCQFDLTLTGIART